MILPSRGTQRDTLAFTPAPPHVSNKFVRKDTGEIHLVVRLLRGFALVEMTTGVGGTLHDGLDSLLQEMGDEFQQLSPRDKITVTVASP